MKRLAIIASGDLGQLIGYHAVKDGHYELAGFFDDYKQAGTMVGEGKILGGVADIPAIYHAGAFDELILAIGYKHFKVRKELFEKLSREIPFGNVIHSSCYVDHSCTIGKGTVLLPGCTLDRNVVIGNNVLLNTGCTIAHDSRVQDHSFLSPAVAVAGFTTIGSCCNIGINTTVIDNITIGDNIQTGGGTVVIAPLQEQGLYVGNPARFIR